MIATGTVPVAPPMTFRSGRLTDALALAQVGRTMFAEAHRDAFAPDDLEALLAKEWSVSSVAKDLADPRNRIVVAAEGDRPVGLAMLRPHSLPGTAGDDTELCRVYLDSVYLGRGIGARLVDAAIASFEARGCGRLWLQAWERNSRALPLYESRGFRAVEKTTYPVGSSAPVAVLMVRDPS